MEPRLNQWEKGFAALKAFHAREGHCLPSRFYVEGSYKLGPWVSNQRYYKDDLSPERKRRLDNLGFVWNWHDYLWERGFTALLKFKRREGHCRVPTFHMEGEYKLGYWVSTQRKQRNAMLRERKARLNGIGFVWEAR